MTEERDREIQALFAGAETDLDGEAFTSAVEAKLRNAKARGAHNRKIWIVGGLLALWALVTLTQGLFASVARGLGEPLTRIGDPALNVIAAPLNSAGALAALCFLAVWLLQRALSR